MDVRRETGRVVRAAAVLVVVVGGDVGTEDLREGGGVARDVMMGGACVRLPDQPWTTPSPSSAYVVVHPAD